MKDTFTDDSALYPEYNYSDDTQNKNVCDNDMVDLTSIAQEVDNTKYNGDTYLIRMKKELMKYNKYYSFSTSKKYDFMDYKAATASGLLADIAAVTSELSAEKRNYRNSISINAFAAYIGYFCALQLFWSGNNVTEDDESYVWIKIYNEMLKLVKKFFNTADKDKKLKFFKQQIASRVKNRCIDRYRSTKNQIKEVPLECANDDDDKKIINSEVSEILFRDVINMIKYKNWRDDVLEALNDCYASKDRRFQITAEDKDIIYMFLGLYDDSEPMSVKNIAKHCGMNEQKVRYRISQAGKKIEKKISEFNSCTR